MKQTKIEKIQALSDALNGDKSQLLKILYPQYYQRITVVLMNGIYTIKGKVISEAALERIIESRKKYTGQSNVLVIERTVIENPNPAPPVIKKIDPIEN